MDFAFPIIESIHNFSTGLEDVTLENFRTSERIVRWHNRAFGSEDFRTGLNYFGIFFQAIIRLNYEVRLVPDYNPILDRISYKYKKVFDIERLLKILEEINYASLQIDLKFKDMYKFIPNSFCKRTIRYHQRNIFKAAGHLQDMVKALNNSVPLKRGVN